MDPIIAKIIVSVLALLKSLLGFFKKEGSSSDFINTIQDFLDKAGGIVDVIWGKGNGDEEPPPNGKPACYIAHGTYGNTRDLTKFYIVRNSLPGWAINGYYRISPFLNKHKPSRLTFLPFLEAIKGVMQ